MDIKKQNIILIFGSFLIIFLDQVSKSWASKLLTKKEFGLFQFKKFYNPGISFGQFSDGEPLVRVVFLSTFFGIILLLTTICLFYFLNKKNLFTVRYPFAFFVAGIVGNGIDRILFGKVTDFIILNFYPKIVFNVADIFILIFGVQSIYVLIRKNHLIWFEENLRGFKIIDSKFQWSFSSKFAVLTFFSNFMMATFCYTILNIMIKDGPIKEKVLSHFLYGFISLTLFFTLFGLLFGLLVTHRSAGPIYALKRFISDLRINPDTNLKLREQDFHKDLEQIAKDIKQLKNR